MELSEKDFTLKVVMPLLRSMGWHKVEYHGGPTELGRDVIAQKTDEWGQPRHLVVQVKKYTPTARAKDDKSWAEIITQMSQAVETPIPTLTGKAELPHEVLFITPFIVPVRSLEMRLEGVPLLRGRGARCVDGKAIAERVLDVNPSIADELIGPSWASGPPLSAQLTNQVLMSALRVGTPRHVSQIFTDLDLGLGSPVARSLLLGHLSPTREQLTVELHHWDEFLSLLGQVEDDWQVSVLAQDIAEAEELCRRAKSERAEWLKRVDKEKTRTAELRDQFLTKVRNLQRNRPQLHSDNPQPSDLSKLVELVFRSHDVTGSRELDALVRLGQAGPVALRGSVQGLTETQANALVALASLAKELRAANASLEDVAHSDPPEPRYRPTIDAAPLATAIDRERTAITGTIRDFNSRIPERPEMAAFLRRCSIFLGRLSSLAQREPLVRALGHQSSPSPRGSADFRITLPISKILECGENIALVGEAGAGKTTALQMHAYQRLQSRTSEAPVLFVPLASAHKSWERLRPDRAGSPNMLGLVASHLSEIGVQVDLPTLEQSLREPGTVVLLDGLDEVAGTIPNVAGQVRGLVDHFPNAQFVVSSRTSGNTVKDLPFVCFSLHPFTAGQRNRFIKAWFSSSDADHSSAVVEHLEHTPEVARVVSNPLLATVLCTLAEAGVPLPASEPNLHEERCRLLLGDYDIHKRIARIRTPSLMLHRLSRKIAYSLHRAQRRSAPLAELQELVLNILRPEPGQESEMIQTGVAELVDPCNLLVPMTPSGELGFGHLRYQEYLAAVEINGNRGIDVPSLMRNSWWHDALLMYAMLADDLDGLVTLVCQSDVSSVSMDLLETMALRRSSSDRRRLLKQIKMHRLMSVESTSDTLLSEDEFLDILND